MEEKFREFTEDFEFSHVMLCFNGYLWAWLNIVLLILTFIYGATNG